MSNFEKKFGKYAIPNLTLVLITCYGVGYLIELLDAGLFAYLTLDPYQILLKGQVWRIFTWLLIPPSGFSILTIVMLFFYYSIGTTMERTLGTYQYNVYLLRGILLTVVAAFLCMGLFFLFPQTLSAYINQGSREGFLYSLSLLEGEERNTLVLGVISQLFGQYASFFSTYYINISIFLAFAACYPEMQVLLMFVIPVKVKWMGILDLVIMGYTFLTGDVITKFAVATALLNFVLFYVTYRNFSHLKPSQIRRRSQFKHKVQEGKTVTKHKCAICGQTDESNPELAFRFCSKCNGNYEYCERHLYTHEHVK